ncbi:MAG: hypothetical protein M4579_003977 [Chaenotheca gracillima]|nr:MAG: hypothetical protein M4579_003977 [Chaenotheca gracillima]
MSSSNFSKQSNTSGNSDAANTGSGQYSGSKSGSSSHDTRHASSSSVKSKLKSVFTPSGTQPLAGSEDQAVKDAEHAAKKQQREADYERLGLDDQVKGIHTGKGYGPGGSPGSGGSGARGSAQGQMRSCH